jgi:hypothetical protein
MPRSQSSASLRRDASLPAARKAGPAKPRPRIVQTPVCAPITDDELRRKIAEAAYFRAQQRGFSPGFELEDWVAAETEVMRSLGLWP